MSRIGEPQREIYVEPLELPEPLREPVVPQAEPAREVEVPQLVPAEMP